MSENNNSTDGGVKLNANLLNRDFMESFQNVVSVIVETNDVKKASDLLKLLEKVLIKQAKEIANEKEIKEFYKKIVIKLKFISLSLLDDVDIVELVKNNFTWQFRIPNYDLLDKLKTKLISILSLEDRDKLKNKIKEGLLKNREIITSKAKLRIIEDWLKNYNSELGSGLADNLKRIQYITSLKSYKDLGDFDVNKLKTLFSFYESLKLSSLTPQGFEEEIPIIVKGKLYIFRQGNLEPVSGKINKKKDIGVPKELEDEAITELKNMLSQYEEGSLEKKAIEEELEKMEVGSRNKE